MVQSGEQNDVLVNVFGTLGAVLWSIQLLPQIYLNWKRGHTRGLQPSMMLLWAAAGLPLGIHNILANINIALQVQAQILTALSLITWAQVMRLGHKWSMTKTIGVTSGIMLLFAGIEAAFIVGFKYGSSSVPPGLLTAMAVLAAIGLGLGVGRHYVDIWQHKHVRGISWGFVLLDAGGDLASLLSVLLAKPVSVESVGIYASELALWIGIMLAGLYWNFPTWLRARRSQQDPSSTPVEADVAQQQDDDASSTHSVFRTTGASTARRLVQSFNMRARRVERAEAAL